MAKCPICSAPLGSDETKGVLRGIKAEDVYCCIECESNIRTIMESEDAAEVEGAISYFDGLLDSITDKEIKHSLSNLIEKRTGTNQSSKQEECDTEEEKKEEAFFWLNSISTATGIATALLFVVSVMFGMFLINGGRILDGLLAIVGIGLAAFLMHASIMVFIGMAEDIRRIRMKIEK